MIYLDNKFDIDKIEFLIGEEDAMEEFDKFIKPHKFSKKYEEGKIKMLKEDNNIEITAINNGKSKGMMKKKVIVLVAAVTAALAISLTAYGVGRKFFVTVQKEEESGKVTYDVKSDTEITEIPLINITPGYLPEGYLPLKGAPEKYAPNGESNGEEGILIYQNDYIYQPESYNISNVEETTIGGVKAYISTSEGMLYKYKIDLIYEEDNQIISVSGTVSLEELKKIAENIKFEVVPGEFLKLYKPVTAEENSNVAPAVPADHVFNLGKEMDYNMSSEENPIFTINKVEIMDKLPEVRENCFWDYNKYLEAINEDGTLKDYERSVSIKWEDNEMKQETETASRKFAYVTLTLRNPFDKELKFINVRPTIEYRTKGAEGALEAFPSDSRGGNEIAGGKEPIYFDKSDYTGGMFYFCDLAPNETKEVHLIYLLDEDYLEDAYITQKGMSTYFYDGGDPIYNFGYYFKIK